MLLTRRDGHESIWRLPGQPWPNSRIGDKEDRTRRDCFSRFDNRNLNTVIVAPLTHGVRGYPRGWSVISKIRQEKLHWIKFGPLINGDWPENSEISILKPPAILKRTCRPCSAKKVWKVKTLSLIEKMSTKGNSWFSTIRVVKICQCVCQ